MRQRITPKDLEKDKTYDTIYNLLELSNQKKLSSALLLSRVEVNQLSQEIKHKKKILFMLLKEKNRANYGKLDVITTYIADTLLKEHALWGKVKLTSLWRTAWNNPAHQDTKEYNTENDLHQGVSTIYQSTATSLKKLTTRMGT